MAAYPSSAVVLKAIDVLESRLAHLIWDANVGLGNRMTKRIDNMTLQLRNMEDRLTAMGYQTKVIDASLVLNQLSPPAEEYRYPITRRKIS